MLPSFRKLLLVALIFGSSVSAWMTPSSARAYHTYTERLLDTTAYSLDRREFRLGLMKLSYGIFKWLQVSTYTTPWMLGVLDEFETFGSPNIELKSTLLNRKRFALSLTGEILWGRISSCTNPQIDPMGEVCTQPEELSSVDWLVYPISVTSSVRVNSRISVHVGGQYTATQALGGARPFEGEVSGTAVVDMLQLYGMLEWRVSKVVALTMTTRWLPYVSQTVVRGELVIDDDTGAIIEIEADILDNNAFAVIPGAVFSWDRANIRLGLGYGAFFVEPVGLVAPASVLSSLSPELDVFVRF